MIRFGPSGIPLSCKGRTLRDGIEDVHNLGLTAMEVQLVRVNLNERFASDEDLGHTIKEVPGELVVRLVVMHLGRYGDLDRTLALERVKDNLAAVRERYKAARLSPALGVEASGLQEVVGGLEELLWLAKQVKGVVPVLNFAHVHAREGGILRRPEDFAAGVDKAGKGSGGPYHPHFRGVGDDGG